MDGEGSSALLLRTKTSFFNKENLPQNSNNGPPKANSSAKLQYEPFFVLFVSSRNLIYEINNKKLQILFLRTTTRGVLGICNV